jgi:hypothetical protein
MLSWAFMVPALQAAAGSCCVVETSAAAGDAGMSRIDATTETDAMDRLRLIIVLPSPSPDPVVGCDARDSGVMWDYERAGGRVQLGARGSGSGGSFDRDEYSPRVRERIRPISVRREERRVRRGQLLGPISSARPSAAEVGSMTISDFDQMG